MKIAVTGSPGVGKSTLVTRVADSVQMITGGIVTGDIRESGRRVGFEIEDIATGVRGILAHVNQETGPRISKYRVCLKDLENIGVKAIQQAVDNKGLIVIDEIGPMELKSGKFIQAVKQAIRSQKPALFSIHQRSNHPMIKQVRSEFKIYEITRKNRDSLVGKIKAKLESQV